uniref:transcriptional regulator n=1 Tax=Pararhizobium sp. IMCC3301 TaxID=3067904 RepID=UPI0027410F25|nr:transcriptional regulator [Pararhizobium sp. IMCC3301]
METLVGPPGEPSAGLTILMMGRLRLIRGGSKITLPRSRKLCGLLAYLALAPHPVGRSRLCELLGDVASDPRGELRWYLSKLRSVLDDPTRRSVTAQGDTIALDLRDWFVDAVQIETATQAGLGTLGAERLHQLCELFSGDFLEGLDLHRSAQLDHWLTAQRRRYRVCHAAMLEQLVKQLPEGDEAVGAAVERWAALAPFDPRAQILLLRTLMQSDQPGEADQHYSAVARLFETEDLEFEPIRRAWREMCPQPATFPGATAATPLLSAALQQPDRSAQRDTREAQRASLAVMPFKEPGRHDDSVGLAEGLTHDIITRLAKLRSLFVIARGSVFALSARGIGAEDAAKSLNVDYVASGVVRRYPDRIIVAAELVEARTARIVWADEFDLKPAEAFLIQTRIGDTIVASIASEIETAEKNRAILKPPSSLNAWESYHRGLWHMYRFTKAENERAQHYFRLSSEADPTFARAYSGISFTHWQNAFQNWADRERESDLAYEAAARSLLADDRDPAAHWAMGRAMWLRPYQDQAIAELEQAVDLSPNFALGHYALSFVHSQSGDPATAIAASDHSRNLSPFDPLLFGMLGARALAHVRLGDFDEAAEWALKAAARPNAHIMILAIAAHCLALAGRVEEAKIIAASIRNTLPSFRVDQFLTTFRFPPDAEATFRVAAQMINLD